MKALYAEIFEDVAAGHRERQQDRHGEAQAEVERLQTRLLAIDEKFVDGDLAGDSYQRLKDKYKSELRKAKARLNSTNDLTGTRWNRHEYALNLLSQLSYVYEAAGMEAKDQLLGSIFPGGIVCEEGDFGTVSANPLIRLLSGEAAKIRDAEGLRGPRHPSKYPRQDSNLRPAA